MNLRANIFNKIDDLSNKTIKNAILVGLSVIFLLAFVYLYKTKYQQKSLCEQYKKILLDLEKTKALITKKRALDAEIQATLSDFEAQPNKSLLKIIENSAAENSITLDPSYKSNLKIIPIEHEANFTEQQTSISTTKLNLKEVINLINSLRNEKFVMFRALEIKNEGTMPNCNIFLSMRQKK